MTAGAVSYIFLDEGGNLDFRTHGSKYFTVTGVLMRRPFALESASTELRFDMMEEGTELEEFHAAEDRQATRDRVFASIKNNLSALRVDSVVVEKRNERSLGVYVPT